MSVPMIPALAAIGSGQVGEISRIAATATAEGTASGSFTSMVERSLLQLNDSMNSADQFAVRLAAGENVDLHQVMIALETSSIGMQTAIQVRNKVLEAYREIMAMPL